MIGLQHNGIPLTHSQIVHQDSQVLFCKVFLYTTQSQPVLLHGIILSQFQDCAFTSWWTPWSSFKCISPAVLVSSEWQSWPLASSKTRSPLSHWVWAELASGLIPEEHHGQSAVCWTSCCWSQPFDPAVPIIMRFTYSSVASVAGQSAEFPENKSVNQGFSMI